MHIRSITIALLLSWLHVVHDQEHECGGEDGDDVAQDDLAVEVAEVRQRAVDEQGDEEEDQADHAANNVCESKEIENYYNILP